MKKDIVNSPKTVGKKEIFVFRTAAFLFLSAILLLRAFERNASLPYLERLSLLLNFNYITNSSFTQFLVSDTAKLIIPIFYILYLYLTATVLQKFYHSLSDEKAFGKTVVSALIIANTSLFVYYCSPGVFDRTGFIVLSAVMVRFLFLRNGLLIATTPVLSALCIMLDHKSFLTVYPAVFIASVFTLNGSRWKKTVQVIDAAVALITFAAVYDFSVFGKDTEFLYSLIWAVIVTLPITVFLAYVFIGAYRDKKEIKYLLCLILPVIPFFASLIIISDTSAVVAQSMSSLIISVLFSVICGEKNITEQVERVIGLCQRKPFAASVLLAAETFFLRVDPQYFGDIGNTIFGYFSF